MVVEGHTEVTNSIKLAEGEPDWWAFMEVRAWKGKTLTLQVDQLPENSRCAKLLSALTFISINP